MGQRVLSRGRRRRAKFLEVAGGGQKSTAETFPTGFLCRLKMVVQIVNEKKP